MENRWNVAVLVGSLRKGSFNRKMANALMRMAPASLVLEIVEIGDLPLYNQDEDANPPAASAAFKARIQQADAVLFVTPEYNRSVPGVLKNAIDIASRPYGKSAWNGKPAAVISVSPGAIGGFGANHALRQSLVFLEHAGAAAAGSLHRWRGGAVRCAGRPRQGDDARFHAEIPRCVCRMDRAECNATASVGERITHVRYRQRPRCPRRANDAVARFSVRTCG